MQGYDEWKLDNGYNDNDESFEENIVIVGENVDDYNMFESELEKLLEKYGYKRS